MFDRFKNYFNTSSLATPYGIAWVVLMIIVGGFCLQYDIEFWAHFTQHHAVAVPLVICFLVSYFVAPLAIVIAVVTWLLHFFM